MEKQRPVDRMNGFVLLGALLACLGTPAFAQAPSAAEGDPPTGLPKIHQDLNLADVAWEYLESLLLQQFHKSAEFLTPETRYQDFSMEVFGREMVDLQGEKAILKFWRESAEAAGTIEVRFDAEKFFVAGPNVYFIGTGFVKNEGKTWGVNMETLDFTFTQISHIRMVDGKVTYHADHVDYAEAFDQLKVYLEEAGPWVPEDKKKK